MMEHFVTLFDRNFLPQGLTLHTSMLRHIPNFTLWVLCIDEYTYDTLSAINLVNVQLLRLSEHETTELLNIKSSRTTREYCWTLSPFAPKFVFDSDPSIERVTYIDADMWFMKDPAPIFQEFEASGKGILITDHAYSEGHDQSITSGQYCVQFIIFNQKNGELVRKWWEDRCVEWCYMRVEDGKFGDQKYLEKWPLLFPDITLVSNRLSSFMAPWNATRFDFEGAVCWHFHGLRIIKIFGQLRIHAGDYWLPLDVKEYIYRPYIGYIEKALKVLKSINVPIPIQKKLSFKDRIKFLLIKIGLYKRRFLSLNILDIGVMTFAPIRKVTLITVCRNSSKYIEETMESVLQQTAVKHGRVELEYLVIDGLSDDGTQTLISQVLMKHADIKGARLISEADNGLYDGLSKALSLSTGDLVGYINAGDYLNPHALDVLMDVFRRHPNEYWVTGLNVIYSDLSQVVGASLPFRYRNSAIKKGLYGSFLPIIQQESTFWRSSLNASIDLEFLGKLKYAGDAYIWKCFASYSGLSIIQAYLGGFRIHKGQISTNMTAYHQEQKSFSDSPNILDYMLAIFDRIIFHSPYAIKKFFNRKGIIVFNHETGLWD